MFVLYVCVHSVFPFPVKSLKVTILPEDLIIINYTSKLVQWPGSQKSHILRCCMLGLKHIFFECTIQSHKSYSALRNHRSFHQGFRDCSSSICLLPILPVAIWALHLWNIAIHLKMSEFSQMDTYFSRLLALGSELVEQHETSEKSAGIIVTMSQPHRELATSSDSCDQILET